MRLLIFVLLLSATAGCSSDRDGARSSQASDDSSAVTLQEFRGAGLVKSVTSNRKHVVVDHEDIPGFMSAMTMPFAVKDTSIATGVQAGDSISFTVEVEGPRITLTEITINR
jgi:protein SCO1/2